MSLIFLPNFDVFCNAQQHRIYSLKIDKLASYARLDCSSIMYASLGVYTKSPTLRFAVSAASSFLPYRTCEQYRINVFQG